MNIENELIQKIKSGNDEAFTKLSQQYSPLIKKEISCFKNNNIDDDELYQIALSTLYNAALSFDITSKLTFGLYAKICINRRLISACKKKNKNAKLFIEHIDEINITDTEKSPEDIVLNNELIKQILSEFDKIFTKKEKQTFKLYLLGDSYQTIAQKMNCTVKSVDGSLSRAKSKIRSYYNQ